MTVTYDRDGAILREIHLMTSNGWLLLQRRADGADFATVPRGSGVSTGAHLVLLALTFGLWLPFLIIVELAAMNRTRFCRLTFDSQGRAQYEQIKKPKKLPSYVDRPASHAVAHAEGTPHRCRP